VTFVICSKPSAIADNQPSENLTQAGADMFLPLLSKLWSDDQGQDIAEYAVMLAVILVIVVGTIRMIGSNANSVFSEAASSIQ
jgi:Flp pilus assembly pilin Flp